MNTLRFNITLPADIGKKLQGLKNISAFIAASVQEKFKRQEQTGALRALEAAYRESAVSDREVGEAWDAASGDGL